MNVPPVPPPTWVRFATGVTASSVVLSAQVDRYRIQDVRTVRGEPLSGLGPGQEFARLESTEAIPPGDGDLIGVTQPLHYTRAVERPDLPTTEDPGRAPICVFIPLKKSEAWWQLAHDERDAIFRGQGRLGHVTVGMPHARTIVRKLYYGRFLPGAGWDMLTYFEFLPERRAEFLALLAGLRDPERNPEWNYVERESEVWLSRI
jgi:hypothetical protein